MIKPENVKTLCMVMAVFTFIVGSVIAQEYLDESGFSGNTLPDPMVKLDGTAVTNPDIWEEVRRPEILNMVEKEMYGRAPGAPEKAVSRVVSMHTSGKVMYKQIEIELKQGKNSLVLEVLICLPGDAREPVPVFLATNFFGNHTITSDPKINISKTHIRREAGTGTNNR
jgi:hypothetical protein